MKKISDARESLGTRTAREHHIIHIAAELPNKDDSIHKERKEILKWAQKRSSGIFPEEAVIGKSFELLAGGRSSAAVNVNLERFDGHVNRRIPLGTDS